MQLKNFSPPPPSGGRLNGPFYYGRASKTRGKKHSSTIYLFQLPVEYLLSKKGWRKKTGEDETFLFKKKEQGERDSWNALENKRESDIEGKISSSFLLRRGPPTVLQSRFISTLLLLLLLLLLIRIIILPIYETSRPGFNY